MAAQKELLYQIALTLIPQIGPVQARILLQHCNAEEIFHSKKHFLEKIDGIGPVRAASITSFKGFNRAEQEIIFLEKYGISPLFITDEKYPKRLLNCYDAPVLLYFKGNADLNSGKILSVIGTRNHTEYGKQVTEKIIKELTTPDLLIISGLAYGIDALAHKFALKNNVSTVGVLAHGLDQLYPFEHTGLAKDMIKNNGGLLTEFISGNKPDKHNFPARNRIVAGISDAVIVIETGTRGGSIITAELANGYNKDVFAVPGKISDTKSGGCNQLIRTNKAQLFDDTGEFLIAMGWNENHSKKKSSIQKELFIQLTKEEKFIMDILKENETIQIDELNLRSGLSNSIVAAALLSLELQGIVRSIPGKMYGLV